MGVFMVLLKENKKIDLFDENNLFIDVSDFLRKMSTISKDGDKLYIKFIEKDFIEFTRALKDRDEYIVASYRMCIVTNTYKICKKLCKEELDYKIEKCEENEYIVSKDLMYLLMNIVIQIEKHLQHKSNSLIPLNFYIGKSLNIENDAIISI